eukprot:Gb_09507 [translate_table: standard]
MVSMTFGSSPLVTFYLLVTLPLLVTLHLLVSVQLPITIQLLTAFQLPVPVHLWDWHNLPCNHPNPPDARIKTSYFSIAWCPCLCQSSLQLEFMPGVLLEEFYYCFKDLQLSYDMAENGPWDQQALLNPFEGPLNLPETGLEQIKSDKE